jgi:hypothetical protein
VATQYATVPAGSYDVEVLSATTGAVLLTGENWPVMAGTVATIVVLAGPAGPTLEVLRDAAGAVTMPQGGLATGEGGMAPKPARAPAWPVLAGLVLVALTAVTVRRRHPVVSRPSNPLGRA